MTGINRARATEIAHGYKDFVASLTLPDKTPEEMIDLGLWWQGEPIANLDALVSALDHSPTEKLLAEAYHRARFYFGRGIQPMSTEERQMWLNRLFDALAANIERLSPSALTPRLQRREERRRARSIFDAARRWVFG